ncbi:thioredoxin reductase 1, cytoplasmic-like [Anabrus simplex]|uniref:thioredoxin reductase 1, cytoplasmic-like n=1 Tax=Anabrus simplex TaxID=316456 RepID=UPI0035A2EE16
MVTLKKFSTDIGCKDRISDGGVLSNSSLFDKLEQKVLPLSGPEPLPKSHDYDLVVIGGGSGGIAAAKEAAVLGKKVAVCDFVVPTPTGTQWGVGGTCVNVGCVPKKLMHKAALLNMDLQDARCFGWKVPERIKHDWFEMITEIQNYVKSLNFGYRKIFREKGIAYFNAYAQFIGPNRIKMTDKKMTVSEITGQHFIIAVGERPKYLHIPGANEFAITSDDIFSLERSPGRTLIVGASYVALECAGFLIGLGFDCTVMVRSILLRGYDQQMANMVGQHLTSLGVKFIYKCVPISIEKISEGVASRLKVTSQKDTEVIVGEYNTVLLAVGREPRIKDLGLEIVGVKLNSDNGRIICNDKDQTSCPYIYAIGDVANNRPQLTPVAIHAGKFLSRRLFGKCKVLTDYINVPSTVFTPIEYGFVGLAEEVAIEVYGKNNIEVYHTHFQPLEFVIPAKEDNVCYAKLICLKKDHERVVGLHILGPNAGEITQGYAIGLKLGAKKSDFSNLIGIHPTCAEILTTMEITKASGLSVLRTGC